MSDRAPDDLRRELAREQDRLSMLDGERARTRERIAALRAELAATSRAGTETEVTAPRSPGDKVALFRSLFRGRADVFARRWVNKRKRTAGYAPACSHEWVREVCEKPCIKCGECLNLDAMARVMPLVPFIAEPEEIATAIAYLASDDARFVTGTTFVIDGGQIAV